MFNTKTVIASPRIRAAIGVAILVLSVGALSAFDSEPSAAPAPKVSDIKERRWTLPDGRSLVLVKTQAPLKDNAKMWQPTSLRLRLEGTEQTWISKELLGTPCTSPYGFHFEFGDYTGRGKREIWLSQRGRNSCGGCMRVDVFENQGDRLKHISRMERFEGHYDTRARPGGGVVLEASDHVGFYAHVGHRWYPLEYIWRDGKWRYQKTVKRERLLEYLGDSGGRRAVVDMRDPVILEFRARAFLQLGWRKSAATNYRLAAKWWSRPDPEQWEYGISDEMRRRAKFMDHRARAALKWPISQLLDHYPSQQ